MSKTREERVAEFHKAFGAPIDAEPTVALLKLRRTLIEEETKELFADIDTIIAHLEKGEKVPRELYENMLKELADLQVVLSGTSVSLRPLRELEEAFRRVHESNMSKLGKDGKPIVRADGKVLKGPNYRKPDMSDLIPEPACAPEGWRAGATVLRYLHMENKTRIGIIVAVLAFAGVWYLLTTAQWSTGEPTSTATTTEQVATTTATTTGVVSKPAVRTTPKAVPAKITGVGQLAYLLNLKEPLVCSVSTRSGYKRSGTMYVAGGKMRANFSTSSMIHDGTYLYVWTSGATKGLKLLASSSTSGSAIATNGGFDPGVDLSYSCNPWTENSSVFTPPTSVSFSNTL